MQFVADRILSRLFSEADDRNRSERIRPISTWVYGSFC